MPLPDVIDCVSLRAREVACRTASWNTLFCKRTRPKCGAPEETGSFEIVVAVSDGLGRAASGRYALEVEEPGRGVLAETEPGGCACQRRGFADWRLWGLVFVALLSVMKRRS